MCSSLARYRCSYGNQRLSAIARSSLNIQTWCTKLIVEYSYHNMDELGCVEKDAHPPGRKRPLHLSPGSWDLYAWQIHLYLPGSMPRSLNVLHCITYSISSSTYYV